MDYIQAFKNLTIPNETLQDMLKRAKQSDFIVRYYKRYAEETGIDKYNEIAARLKGCHSYWDIDKYDKNKILNVNMINNCHSKFCLNCLKLIQATRLYKMHGAIETAQETNELYHTVFTVKNVSSENLLKTLKLMTEAFTMLVRYISGEKKIKGVDFNYLGYYACIRAIEITYSDRKGWHPHIHAIFAFKKGLDFKPEYRNSFSYDNIFNERTKRWEKVWRRDFSFFEILLQKIWYLLTNYYTERDRKIAGIEKFIHDKNLRPLNFKNDDDLEAMRVFDKKAYLDKIPNYGIKAKRIILDNIIKLAEGYSCYCEKVDKNNYFEVFKYLFKMTDDDGAAMSYEQFKTLLTVSKNLRTVQTYGAWYGIKLDETIDDTGALLWYVAMKYLNENESPVSIYTTLSEVVEDSDNGYMVITKKKIFQYIDSIPDAEKNYYLNHIEQFITEYQNYLKAERIKRMTKLMGYSPADSDCYETVFEPNPPRPKPE